MKKLSYEEKITRILNNRLEYKGNHAKEIEDVKTWLCCEWQCDIIEDMNYYQQLLKKVDDIAKEIIREM